MKRAIAAMLALVLSLGVVAPTWAEETGEEDVVLQATGETYDAGEDTAAPMMMLAARGAAANTVTEIGNRLAAYITVCDNFAKSHGGKVYWTAQQWASKRKEAEKTEKSEIDRQRESDGQAEMEKKAAEGDYLAGLSDVGCTVGKTELHKYKTAYTCNSNYFKGIDSGFGQCQGFTDYLAYVLFGDAGKVSSNFDKITNIDYTFNFQPGDIVRVLDAKGKNGHSMMVYEGSGSSAKVIECNWGHNDRGYCNIRWDKTVGSKGNLREPYYVSYVWRPMANLQVTTTCPYAPHDPGVTLSDGTYQFRTAQKDGKWTALCKGCGVVYDYMASFNTGDAGVYKVVDATGDGLCSAPYKEASISPLTVGNKVTVIGSVKNAYDNKWMQTADGWIYSGKIKRAENAPTIVNSGYCGGEGDGKNLSWTLDSEGLLTISGRGKMSSDNLYGGWMTWWGNELIDVTEIDIQPGVTTVGDSAFRKQDNLKKVTLPNTLTSIGNNAFESCPIASITIPAGVTSIGDQAFMFCDSLTEVLLPEGLLDIGKEAFEGCRGLKTISFPTTFRGIGNDAFADCTKLEKIYFNATCAKDTLDEDAYDESAFAGAGTEGKGISVIFGSGVTWIPSCLFSKANIRDIELPNGVTGIGIAAFEGSSIVSITIPASVNFIGFWAFSGCSALTDVYYGGTRAQWNAITIRNWNEPLMSANIHFLATGATVRPGTGAKQEVKAGADGKMAITVPNVVNNKAATVTFDQAAVENISGYGDMTLTVRDNTANLSGILKNSAEVKGKNAASIIVTLTKADGTPVFTEGTSAGEAVITIPYKTGLVAEKIKVFYVNGEKLTSQAFTYNALTGIVTLKLAHFSEYLIVSESEGVPTPTPGTGTTTSGHGQAASSGAAGAKNTSAETFDPGVGVYAVTAVLSLTGMAWIRRKRR